ncbi:MAG: hypothetical protein IKP88_01740 [Lachnospiraceae bacterium]|nr:hypothetical protein [Lachnospiraceae bacterium]
MRNKNVRNKYPLLFILCTCIVLGVTGCIGSQYTKEDEKSTLDLGKKMMQEWLDKNLKGEKVSDNGLSVLKDGLLGGNYYLSNLVEGTYSDNGENFTFIINTTSGAVYSSKYYREFRESAWNLFLKELNFDENETIPENSENKMDGKDHLSVYYYVDASLKEGKYNKEAAKQMPFPKEVLPIEIEDAAGYVENFKSRNPIEISGSIHLNKNADLSAVKLNVLMDEKDKAGINISNMYIYDDDEHIVDYGTSLIYKKFDYLDMGDYKLYAVVEQRSDKYENGEINHTEAKLDTANYHPITALDSGYDIKPGPDDEIHQEFNIIAEADSEIIKYNYNLENVNSEGVYVKADECYWKDRGDGTYVLAIVGKDIVNFGFNYRLTVREEFSINN